MTAQVHEKITIDGKRTSMAFCPPIPENHPRITMIPFEEYVPTREDGLVGSEMCIRDRPVGVAILAHGQSKMTNFI